MMSPAGLKSSVPDGQSMVDKTWKYGAQEEMLDKMMNLSVDMLEVLSDILVEKALVNVNLGLRREVEAAPIWLWMRWPKRRL